MRTSLISLLKHILVFIVIEIIFVLILFKEFPETNLLSLIGILHTSYRWVLILFARLRQVVTLVRQKFTCTYVPILYHVGIHVYIWRATLETHNHDEHSLMWIIAGAIWLWVLIAAGEWYLHRALHCQTHHSHTHYHCVDDCEHTHSKEDLHQ